MPRHSVAMKNKSVVVSETNRKYITDFRSVQNAHFFSFAIVVDIFSHKSSQKMN